MPPVGGLATGGTWRGSGLNGTVQRGGLPTTGGSSVKSTTTKGGFGTSSRGFFVLTLAAPAPVPVQIPDQENP